MKLEYYREEIERETREILEGTASDALDFEKLSIEHAKDFAVAKVYHDKCRAVQKQMINEVALLYQKYPESLFYGDFLKEMCAIIEEKKKAGDYSWFSKEIQMLELQKQAIRKGRFMATKKGAVIVTEEEFA